jgi:hypothetical protein
MVTEAALLGTPALLVNTLTAGNWFDLRDQYGLLYFYPDGREATEKALELLKTPNLKEIWAQKRARMLSDKIDPTPWLVDQGNRTAFSKVWEKVKSARGLLCRWMCSTIHVATTLRIGSAIHVS